METMETMRVAKLPLKKAKDMPTTALAVFDPAFARLQAYRELVRQPRLDVDYRGLTGGKYKTGPVYILAEHIQSGTMLPIINGAINGGRFKLQSRRDATEYPNLKSAYEALEEFRVKYGQVWTYEIWHHSTK